MSNLHPVFEGVFEDMGLDPVPFAPWQIHSQTSADAAAAIKPRTQRLREQVYETIRAYSHAGISDADISELSGIPLNTVRPRRIELQREGRIVSAGTRKGDSGRQMNVWIIS